MDNNGEVVYLYLDDIIPNRFQPREVFDDQALKELAVSIKEHGVIQPIIVRKVENKYEIIAGERRYKASTMAGLTKIPAIVKNLDDKESSKVALIENLQRKDLSPIEEARTYQKILQLEDGMTQEQLAATMGKTQSSVSNKLRLLDLPEEIQDALLKDKISERHARSLLSLEDKNEQIKMMDKVIAEKMTVRELDKEIKTLKEGPIEENNSQNNIPTFEISNNESAPIMEQSAETSTTPPMETLEDNVMEQPSVTVETTPSFQPLDISSLGKPAEEQVATNEPSQNEVTDNNIATESSNDLNPTSVDIDKIRETSTDISFNANEPQKTESTEFSFVPSFGNAEEQPKAQEEQVESATDINQFFNANVSSDSSNTPTDTGSTENNSIPSFMNPSGITIPSVTPTLDMNKASTDIKNTITNLKNSGYNITFEEIDEPTNYKINIQINK